VAIPWDESYPDGDLHDMDVVDDELRGTKVALRTMFEVEHEGPTATAHGRHRPGAGRVYAEPAATLLSRIPLEGQVGFTTDTFRVYFAVPKVGGGFEWKLYQDVVVVPTGTVCAWAGDAAPAGYLLCDGAAYGRTSSDPNPQPALFGVIGTAYNVGPGLSDPGGASFRVPDWRGRYFLGGGQGSGLTNRARGTWGGVESVAVSDHTHSLTLVPIVPGGAGLSIQQSFTGYAGAHSVDAMGPWLAGGTPIIKA
jgi:microcystin-dependent protein